ncbi:MAG: circularly permuted type 2 ATP-grasp protein [bacterium]
MRRWESPGWCRPRTRAAFASSTRSAAACSRARRGSRSCRASARSCATSRSSWRPRPATGAASSAAAPHVLENLRGLVVKPAFRPRRPGAPREPIFAESLGDSELDQLVGRIQRAPHDFVAQQRLDLASTPSWTGSTIEPRRVMLRAYVLGCDGHYTVLPGGLGRISSSAEALVVSMQRGGGSKDVWVCSSEPVAHVPMIEAPHPPIELRRGGVRLPSRVADDLFWLGRYAERCESATRVFRAVLNRLSDESGLTAALELAALLEILGADAALIASWTGDAEGEAGPAPDRLGELVELVFADAGRVRLAATLERLHHAAWRVRERISGDTWRILNQIRERVPDAQAVAALGLSGAAAAANEILAYLAAVSGLEAESMTRGNAWRFLEAGRRLERAMQTAQLLSVAVGRSGDDEVAVLRAVLEVADSALTYRSRYLAALRVGPVLDLLLVDETNPRSVGFQLAALERLVNELPRERNGMEAPAAEHADEWQRVPALAARMRATDVERLATLDEHGERAGLTELLDAIATELPRVSDLLARQYFSPAETHRQLAPASHARTTP